MRSVLCADDLALIVRPASLADAMRRHERSAFAATNESRSCHLPVSSSLVTSRGRMFVFRTNGHLLHLLCARVILYKSPRGIVNRNIKNISVHIFVKTRGSPAPGGGGQNLLFTPDGRP